MPMVLPSPQGSSRESHLSKSDDPLGLRQEANAAVNTADPSGTGCCSFLELSRQSTESLLRGPALDRSIGQINGVWGS